MIQKFHRELIRWLDRTKDAGQTVVRRRFFLEGALMLSPDIAYIAANGDRERVNTELGHTLELCPNFIVEFCSHPRELRRLKEKMLRWMASGAELGWLMVPQEQCVYIYSSSSEPLIFDGEFAVGQGLVVDFAIILPEIWSLDEYKRSF